MNSTVIKGTEQECAEIFLEKAEDETQNGNAQKWPKTGLRNAETEMTHVCHFFKMHLKRRQKRLPLRLSFSELIEQQNLPHIDAHPHHSIAKQ